MDRQTFENINVSVVVLRLKYPILQINVMHLHCFVEYLCNFYILESKIPMHSAMLWLSPGIIVIIPFHLTGSNTVLNAVATIPWPVPVQGLVVSVEGLQICVHISWNTWRRVIFLTGHYYKLFIKLTSYDSYN